MKLRQYLAVGAASALLMPAAGVLAASPVHAAGDTATLDVQAPGVVGVNAKPLEFAAKIGNKGGLTHADARLFLSFDLGPFFRRQNGDLDASGLSVQFRSGGAWRDIDLRVEDGKVVGSPDRKFLEEAKDETLRLRVSVDDTQQLDLGNAAKAKSRGAKDRAAALAGSVAAGTLSPDAKNAPDAKTAPDAGTNPCGQTEPGFTLDTALRDVDQAGKPVGNPIATDTDKVELGTAQVDLQGPSGDITVGATPKAFSLTLCNPSDSSYGNVAPLLVLMRGGVGEPSSLLKASDVVLEISDGTSFAPVPVFQLDDAVYAYFADEEGNGVALAARAKDRGKLRLGFRNGTKPGKAAAVALAVLPETNQVGGQDESDFQIVPAPVRTPPPGQGRPSPELPDTGAGATPAAALLGAGLLVAGTGAVVLARRRRGTS